MLGAQKALIPQGLDFLLQGVLVTMLTHRASVCGFQPRGHPRGVIRQYVGQVSEGTPLGDQLDRVVFFHYVFLLRSS